jgi:hypothetical protein
MSESARLTRKLNDIQSCDVNLALQKARAMYGNVCNDACLRSPTVLRQETPRESDRVEKEILGPCYTFIGPSAVATESQRISSKIQCVADASIDPLNPDARFQVYADYIPPPVCPAVPTEVLNASMPKASTRCIPGNLNKPYLSSGI